MVSRDRCRMSVSRPGDLASLWRAKAAVCYCLCHGGKVSLNGRASERHSFAAGVRRFARPCGIQVAWGKWFGRVEADLCSDESAFGWPSWSGDMSRSRVCSTRPDAFFRNSQRGSNNLRLVSTQAFSLYYHLCTLVAILNQQNPYPAETARTDT